MATTVIEHPQRLPCKTSMGLIILRSSLLVETLRRPDPCTSLAARRHVPQALRQCAAEIPATRVTLIATTTESVASDLQGAGAW